jgi:NAD+ synthase
VNKYGFPGSCSACRAHRRAISAAVAADALGAGPRAAVDAPSPYTSADSGGRGRLRPPARHPLRTIAIGPAMDAFAACCAPAFGNRPPGHTEENLQSRIRGVTLMALSNKFGDMLLTTGNKSEMSTGYATLYGDMCGGYSVLKDVYKTASSRSAAGTPTSAGALGRGAVMPDRVITKPPRASSSPTRPTRTRCPLRGWTHPCRLVEREAV